MNSFKLGSFNKVVERIKNILFISLKRTTDSYLILKTTAQKIYVTSEHPFYVSGKGWIKAKDLTIGDNLKTASNKIESVLEIKENLISMEVYNIEVEKNNNYFISPAKILVHNKKIIIKDEEKKEIIKTTK